MQENYTKSDLLKEINELGLNVPDKASKQACIDVLSSHYLSSNHDENLSMMVKLGQPMLCGLYSNLNSDFQEEIWDSKDYVLEEKLDGMRIVGIFNDGKFSFYSRTLSTKTFLPISFTSKINLDNVDTRLINSTFIFDAELISPNNLLYSRIMESSVLFNYKVSQIVPLLLNYDKETALSVQKDCPLEFKVFDCMYYNGEWLVDKPLIERISYVPLIVKELQKAGLNANRVFSNYTSKKSAYRMLIANKSEGGVLKNLYYPYESNSRPKYGFIKVKPSMSDAEGLFDTIDAYVYGGHWVDRKFWLEFRVNVDGNSVEIARLTDFSTKFLDAITFNSASLIGGSDRRVIKPAFIGKVAELGGYYIDKVTSKLKGAYFNRWRLDKQSTDCRMSKDYFNSISI